MKNLFDLTGKVAVVVGGATGLGRGMACALADAGATVVIASRRLEVSVRCPVKPAEEWFPFSST
ncbi:MAG: SDR family NAD(P)-dependent oxidoreductase [Oscillospiraceae bacterium]|nr:SDR family NAD(P)-dependent oxidoreductase [Oscillospiraceae bacterium]